MRARRQAGTGPEGGSDSGTAAVAARLDEVEVKLGYVDDLLDTLNRTVFRQQQQIEQLAQALAALRQSLRPIASGAASDPRDEIPPHY
jgi:SlyX protein